MGRQRGAKNEESTWVKKARAGDRAAFDRLVSANERKLKTLVSRKIGKRLAEGVDLEDVLQETYLRAFKAIDKFEWQGEDSFSRWLLGIANHVILKLTGKRHVLKLELENTLPSKDDSPGTALRRQERFNRLQDALWSLSPDHREVIVLARIQGLRINEIAVRMNRSPDAVTQLLSRALEKLKASFGETDSFHLPDQKFKEGEGGDG